MDTSTKADAYALLEFDFWSFSIQFFSIFTAYANLESNSGIKIPKMHLSDFWNFSNSKFSDMEFCEKFQFSKIPKEHKHRPKPMK